MDIHILNPALADHGKVHYDVEYERRALHDCAIANDYSV
jgi:hypothetical protein